MNLWGSTSIADPGDKLLESYRAAIRAADALPVHERALVVHEVVKSAAAARDRLRSRSHGSDALANRFEEFRAATAREDTIGKGLGLASEHKGKLATFSLKAGIWLGAVGAGLLAALSTIGKDTSAMTPLEMAELQARIRQMAFPAVAYSGALLAWARQLAKEWNDKLSDLGRVGIQAQAVLRTSVDTAERAFFGSLGASPPPHTIVGSAGTAASLAWVAGTAIIVLLVLAAVFGVFD